MLISLIIIICNILNQPLSHTNIVFEKSIKAERLEHQQTKIEQQSRFKELKEFRDKSALESNHKIGALQQNYTLLKSQTEDANLKFGALQQNYKILKTRHDDLVEEFQRMQVSRSELLKNMAEEHKTATENVTQQLQQRTTELADLKVICYVYFSIFHKLV